MSGWFRPCKEGIELAVRLTPHSSSDRIDGIASGANGAAHLAARVRAVPEKGKANAALEELVAEWIGVPKRSVSVTAGATARIKKVLVAGDADDLARRLAELEQGLR